MILVQVMDAGEVGAAMVPSSPFVSMAWAMAGWITDGGRVADLAWKS